MSFVVITGCGASATKYMATVFSRANHPMGHELVLVGGISSWICATGPTQHEFHGASGRRGVIYNDLPLRKVILHQVRHPVKTISTAQRFRHYAVDWIVKHTPQIGPDDSKLLSCMKYWLYWNRMAEKLAEWTYTIEALSTDDAVWEEFCRRVGHPEWEEYRESTLAYDKAKPVNTHTNQYTPRTWEDLEREDKELTEEIREQAKRYGY